MNELSELLKLLNTYGFSFLISGVSLLFAVKYLHFKVKTAWTHQAKPSHQDTPDQYTIQTHSLFSTLDYVLQIGINRLFWQNRFKQVLFHDYLTVLFRTKRDHLTRCLSCDVESMSPAELESYLTRCVTDMIIAIERAIMRELTPHFGDTPSGQNPGELLVMKYNQRFESHHQILFESIAEFCSTQCLTSNGQRVAAVLYTLKSLSLLTMLDAERVFRAMNGEMAGWTYKGVKNEGHYEEPYPRKYR